MQMVAELLDDRKTTVLLDHYRDNEPVTDLEAELENLEKADSAEDKGVDSDRGESANDDKTADTSTEITFADTASPEKPAYRLSTSCPIEPMTSDPKRATRSPTIISVAIALPCRKPRFGRP